MMIMFMIDKRRIIICVDTEMQARFNLRSLLFFSPQSRALHAQQGWFPLPYTLWGRWRRCLWICRPQGMMWGVGGGGIQGRTHLAIDFVSIEAAG